MIDTTAVPDRLAPLWRRAKCELFGHPVERSEVYRVDSRTFERGFECSRCGKTEFAPTAWELLVRRSTGGEHSSA